MKMEPNEGVSKGMKRSFEDVDSGLGSARLQKKKFKPELADFCVLDSSSEAPEPDTNIVIKSEENTVELQPKSLQDGALPACPSFSAPSDLIFQGSSSDDNLAMKIKDSNNNKTQAFPSSNPTGPSANISPKMSASSTSRKVYGLRPRTSMRRPRSTSPVDVPATVAEPKKIYDEPSASSCSMDASLPSPAAPSPTKGKGSSSKPRVTKSKPLSRYRRITANARERDRMKEINSAFATLRAVLPTFANSRIASMTKYSTLQLAASYIKALSDILNEAPTAHNENKKENNCPTYQSGMGGNMVNIATSNHQNVNLSVGISEISFNKSTDCDSHQKNNDFSIYSSNLNPNANLNDITDDNLGELADFSPLPDMCWTLDLMLE